MGAEPLSAARIVLLGLDDSLAKELGDVLTRQGQSVYHMAVSGAEWLRAIRDSRADVVFCPSDRTRFLPLIEALHQNGEHVPIVVVSRFPEMTDWLDAMDAGASDYCAPPFESRQMRWILDATLKRRHKPVVRSYAT